ncbi:MAG: heme-copper oxidase subunit III [Acidobacteria bacterium]|nr:heme-copper oxidase subunit III [Acidobacteriota bacterium]
MNLPALTSSPAGEKPKSGQGRGGVHPPAFGGGGDQGPGDGSSDYGRRLRRARIGLVLGLASISVLFVTVTAIFFLRHAALVLDPRTGAYVPEWLPAEIPLRLLLLNTVVLLLSSGTIEMARRSLAREMVLAPVRAIPGIAWDQKHCIPWLPITILLGFVFLGGQWMAWEAVRAHGFHVASPGLSPFFYLLTGAHAAHLSVGIIALFYSAANSLFSRRLEQRRIVLEIATWYWHFMGLLWVYIFALLVFGR